MSQRYFLTTESTYEALRLAVDGDLGYPTATASSIFTPALQAPRDSLRRIVLAVNTSLPGYSAVNTRVAPLLANSSVQELTEAEYLAFLACVPATTDAVPFTQVMDSITYTNFLPSGGSLDSALSDIDYALTGRALAADFDQGVRTTDNPQFSTVSASGVTAGNVSAGNSLNVVDPTDLTGPSVTIQPGSITLGPGTTLVFSDSSVQSTAGAALSHAHSATADLTFAGATAGQVLTVNSGATALVWATPATPTIKKFWWF